MLEWGFIPHFYLDTSNSFDKYSKIEKVLL